MAGEATAWHAWGAASSLSACASCGKAVANGPCASASATDRGDLVAVLISSFSWYTHLESEPDDKDCSPSNFQLSIFF